MNILFQDTVTAVEEDLHLRLDKFLSLRFPSFSRTYFQYLIDKGNVRINQSSCKKREKIRPGDEIAIAFEHTPELTLEPENIPLDILFEDEDILIVNKPANMVVHPGAGHFTGTFVHALLFHCKKLQGLDPLRPGIVHRLDKDTSGVLLAAKTSQAHAQLTALFSERKIKKTYQAVCLGHPTVSEVIAPIKRHPTLRQEMHVCPEGKFAHTKLQVLAKWESGSLLDIELITGRTHQIRVHLKHIGCPILGDPVYGRTSVNEKLKITRQFLHAKTLSFIHPRTSQQIVVEAPLAPDMQTFIAKAFS